MGDGDGVHYLQMNSNFQIKKDNTPDWHPAQWRPLSCYKCTPLFVSKYVAEMVYKS